MSDQRIQDYLNDRGWLLTFREERSPRDPIYFPTSDLSLSSVSLRALEKFEKGIYRHQRESIASYLSGNNLAVTTSTASGKTLIFNVCALEELVSRPSSRVVAVYPLKALATEQTLRWRAVLKEAGIEAQVGRIDGGIPTIERPRILRDSRVIVMTPDVIHAWLLSSINSPAVLEFLRNLSLIVIDEAHTYSGVFGSNSAFLFRRIVHACRNLGGSPRFIASSATMQGAHSHLAKLTGEDFTVIGPETDTSPRSKLTTLLATPPLSRDPLTGISDLVAFAATSTDHQSITFVDSRKQTEYLAAIIERRINEEQEDSDELDFERLRSLQIYPYRSGYEEEDRQKIQTHLAAGSLRGVVSTSALEMGIDLPYLSLGVLIGVPRSGTSFHQRVGRVGRQREGLIVVVNNGSVVSETIFREPERINLLPLNQSALYLHNGRIQYIHAMCLARPGGEDEAVKQSAADVEGKFLSPANLPADFLALCASEKVGEIGTDLQSMKAQAGDDPHHVFPLRDLDVQFKVEHRRGPDIINLGSLSYSQLMREAYPGAVYYYQTRPYRVVRIRKQQRVAEVRPEKRYFTSPTTLPVLILPNLSGENIYQSRRFGDLFVTECALQVGEAVVGYKERRGSSSFTVGYPLDPVHGIFQDAAKFARYSFTSGVIFTHPALSREHVRCSDIAQIVDEAFLMSLPFERQDISSGSDRHRATRDFAKEGDRFICVYDQTYGSLRLTSHIMEMDVLRETFTRGTEIALNDSNFKLNTETLSAFQELADCVAQEQGTSLEVSAGNATRGEFVCVIMPGSIGINVRKDNEEFEVEHVFYSPQIGGPAYRGKHISEKRRAESATPLHSQTTVMVSVDHIRPLEGESKVGFYNTATGELVDRLPLSGEF